ncbi:Crp/Fnr family transcriptional regulator [Paenibacillus sp. R14(2021)]|uniref:Crp/Fnr family transcriptional regulator n=1 Tax=Paenibacillus sp. R14(2021) TaxID=2859228 RepID=UPI001C61166F|nr:Crp/Fnr family transcriptional regulator [Paenibacillus sp. R14(2021)]
MLHTTKPSHLSQIGLFASLPPEILNHIELCEPIAEFQTVAKNTIVQTPEEDKHGLFFVIEGVLRLFKTNAAGKQYTIGMLSSGSIYGEIDVFSMGTNGYYMETLEDTVIGMISKEQAEQILRTYPEVSLRFLSELSCRLHERNEVLEKLTMNDLRGKVIFFLHKLSKRFGVKENNRHYINLPFTHQELANMIGGTRESVTLILQELAKEGAVITARKNIMVRVKKLNELLENK